ncbi:unnamed protein product, partial [Mesorhabditis spiculigera]
MIFVTICALLFGVAAEQSFMKWFGLEQGQTGPAARFPPLKQDVNFANREIRRYNSSADGEEQLSKVSQFFQLNEVARFDKDDSYYCYVCVDQQGLRFSPITLAGQVQNQMRVPSPPGCSTEKYGYEYLCQGPCILATYYQNGQFLGELRDCATSAAFKEIPEQDLRLYPSPPTRVIDLGSSIKVHASICRGNYCNGAEGAPQSLQASAAAVDTHPRDLKAEKKLRHRRAHHYVYY